MAGFKERLAGALQGLSAKLQEPPSTAVQSAEPRYSDVGRPESVAPRLVLQPLAGDKPPSSRMSEVLRYDPQKPDNVAVIPTVLPEPLARQAMTKANWEFDKSVPMMDNSGRIEPAIRTVPGILSEKELNRIAGNLNFDLRAQGLKARVQESKSAPGNFYLAIPTQAREAVFATVQSSLERYVTAPAVAAPVQPYTPSVVGELEPAAAANPIIVRRVIPTNRASA